MKRAGEITKDIPPYSHRSYERISKPLQSDILKRYFDIQLPSPLIEMPFKDFSDYSIYAKRDDLINPFISGNKYRKLKYNLIKAVQDGAKELIAFGGAFSNLLHSLSYISSKLGINTTFYIRGDSYDSKNPTLEFIKNNGVQLKFLSRTEFKLIREEAYLKKIKKKHPDSYIIPEGGSNNLAVPGSAEIVDEVTQQLRKSPDYIIMDLGTGGTFAGVLSKLNPKTKLIGISAIKGVDWDKTLTKIFDGDTTLVKKNNWIIFEDYNFGGFARFNQELIDFINNFKKYNGVQLEPIYSGKLVFGMLDLLNKNYFKKDSTIVWVHGGGLQGIEGFNYLNGNLIKK